jgi:two-component system nitrate/nitrite response regulator NarL
MVSHDQNDAADSTLVEDLSPREHEVLRLLARGLTDAAIARELGIAAATVRHHMDALRGKLQCHNRVQVLLVAQGRGMLERTKAHRRR